MKLLGDDIDGNAVLLVEICECHQDHPLGTADSEGPRPEIAQFLEVNADRIDRPDEPPDGFLMFGGRFTQIDIPCRLRILRSFPPNLPWFVPFPKQAKGSLGISDLSSLPRLQF